MPRVTKRQAGLYLCHLASAKKRLAHLLMGLWVLTRNKLFNNKLKTEKL